MALKKNEKQIAFAAKRYTDHIVNQVVKSHPEPMTEDETNSIAALVNLTALTIINDLNKNRRLK